MTADQLHEKMVNEKELIEQYFQRGYGTVAHKGHAEFYMLAVNKITLQ